MKDRLKERKLRNFIGITRLVKTGHNLVHLSLQGSLLWQIRAALGLMAVGPIVSIVQTPNGHEVFMGRLAPPRRLAEIGPWLKASFTSLPAVAYTLNIVIAAHNLFHTALTAPGTFFARSNLFDLIWALVLIALYLDGRHALKQITTSEGRFTENWYLPRRRYGSNIKVLRSPKLLLEEGEPEAETELNTDGIKP